MTFFTRAARCGRARLLPSASLLLALAACDGGSTTPADAGPPDSGSTMRDAGPMYPPECENVNPGLCMLPWPSSFYIEGTGAERHIEIPSEAMPANVRRVHVDTEQFRRFDGFSPATSMVTMFRGDVDPSNLPDELHIDGSLAATSPTVLLEVAEDGTATRVAHYAELDMWPDMDADRRPFYIRPAARLREGTRYVVAIRDVRLRGGAAVEPSAYFAALRDGTTLAEPSDMEDRRAHFEDIFTILESADVERDTLIEAWDFETATGERLWGELVDIRDRALLAVEADTAMPRCTVEVVTDDEAPDAQLWRVVEGTVRVPLFLESSDPGTGESSRIHRGADGSPEQNGFADVPFTARIPRTVYERVRAGRGPGRLLTYGHGLFGSQREGSSGALRTTVEELEMVNITVDWWGMSAADTARVALTLQEFSDFYSTAERLEQGLVNFVVLTRSFIMEGGCGELPELQIPLEGGGTAPSFDPAERYYYGNSQGGIMGLSLAGISTDIERFVIGVGGMTYSTMIPRSSNWNTYGGIMALGYEDPLERAALMAASQTLWDLSEPGTYVPHILRDPLPCDTRVCGESGLTPVKHVLFHIGVDDEQVATVTADTAARTMGLGYLDPAPYTPWGLDRLTAPVSDALVIFTIPGTPVTGIGTRQPPRVDNPAHEGPRRAASARAQMDQFFRPEGTIVQTCDGPCDPD